MVEATVTIINEHGFHVRPTTSFVELARQYEAAVQVSRDGMRVEGKSPMGLLTLGAVAGDNVTIHCDGPDEGEALKALVELINSRFGGIQ